MATHSNISQAATMPATDAGQAAFYGRNAIVPMPIIERAEGIWFFDDTGRGYIDVSSGPVLSNIGHGNAHVISKMAEQAQQLDYVFARLAQNQVNIDYSIRLCEAAGPGFDYASLASGGSEAMENAIKFLRQHAIATGHPAKRHIITCQPSYHGATIAMLGINGDIMMAPFVDGFSSQSHKVPAPLNYRVPDGFDADSYAAHCAQALDDVIVDLGAETVLAFVIEPIGGLSTGCVVPPASYIKAVRDICTAHGVHLVFDEILCGAGRTGQFLAAHAWPDALPDIVTMAKGLGSGYSPLGAMLAPARLVDELADLTGFEFQYSYNANPISCAVGNAVLDEFARLDLLTNTRARSDQLSLGLEAIKANNPIIGDIRGKGLLLAVELVADRQTKKPFANELRPTDRVRIHGLNNGLLIYSRPTSGGKYGHWFLVSPPLTVTDAECVEILSRLETTLQDLAEELG